MASASGAAELLARVTGLLDAAGIPYMLTGSFASTLRGQAGAIDRQYIARWIAAMQLGSQGQAARALAGE